MYELVLSKRVEEQLKADDVLMILSSQERRTGIYTRSLMLCPASNIH